ncbi:AAA family ATPase [Pseudoalteromonas sp. T1lg24]|uniref:AAA family ATPase n=1 Tax=Pseudoalteromonas sp. T1lg24 TaxID=2077099 RepID=UPI000CF6A8C6|nr:AAA family ATPase [Pseudoalteromonas sp. T1lg24]
MRLASIKLAGFKSFVEPSKIPFPDQMTCVVGPNGCGKSNVIDAVRWVLGESSAKNLRGDAMTDVIFNGSTERKPVSQASVELLFDNTEGRLPGTLASRNQIAIKRLVTREGVSQYYLNGEKCRKRDITDIFLGTGLGPRSYAIIEQGMISRLIESKPQDLRIFLEEAAGVSKYKERRRETQTRLNSTRDNLERLLDLRTELENQLNVLTEQAEKARTYTTAKAKERTLKAQICVLKWQALQQKLLESEEKLAQINEQIAFLSEAHSGHDDVISALKLAIEQANDMVNDAQHQEYQLRNKLARDEQDKVHKQSQKTQLSQRIAQLQTQYQQIQQEQQQTKQQFDDISEQVAFSNEALESTAEQLEISLHKYEEQKVQQETSYSAYQASLLENQTIIKEQTEQQKALSALNVKYAQLSEQQSACQQRQSQLKSERETLEQQLEAIDLTQAKTLVQQAEAECESANIQLQQAQDVLAQKHTAARKSEQTCNDLAAKQAALLTVVGENTQSQSGSPTLVSKLSVDKSWQVAVEASLFNLSHAHVSAQFDNECKTPSIWPQTHHCANGSLAEKITTGPIPQYFNAIAAVENIDTLEDDFWSGPFLFAVDQRGDLRGANWCIPCEFDSESSHIVKHQLLKDIEKAIPAAQSELESAQKALTAEQKKVDELRVVSTQKQHALSSLMQLLTQKQAEHNFASERLAAIAKQCDETQNELAALVTQLDAVGNEQAPLTAQLTKAETRLSDLKQQQESLEADYHNAKLVTRQLQNAYENEKNQHHKQQLHLESVKNQAALCESKLGQFSSRFSELNEQLEEAKFTLEDIQLPLVELDEAIAEQHLMLEALIEQKSQKQRNLDDAKEKLKQAESGIGTEQQKLDNLKQQRQNIILEQQGFQLKSEAALSPLAELNTQLKDVIATLPEDAKLNSLQSQLNKVSSDIAGLGAINLAAIEEFDKAFERKNYLDQQYDDLISALDTLETAIVKIDRETKQRFKATFDQVNNGLQNLFPKVFGGGSAYLELTSDDLLETGVAIMARPPGKKNATIHLLSGGEKALTALSLVFSIFQLNPAPFCMLDEVDAPLDDANVGRFCRLVEEMSQDVQFVYISHNKIAMEMAARLTGVTMAEPGVSRVVAVDIEKALEMSESA